MTARRQLRAAIEDPNVVEPEKTAGEHVSPLWILAVHPPVEIQHQSLKGTLEEAYVGPAQLGFYSVEKQSRPGVYGRVHIAEVPLIGWDLPAGMCIEGRSE